MANLSALTSAGATAAVNAHNNVAAELAADVVSAVTALNAITATATELNKVTGVTAGQAIASKAVVTDANVGVSGLRQIVNLAAASQSLTALQSGQLFVGAVDAVFTLPAAAAGTAGVWYDFECGALSSGTSLSLDPAAADAIGGNGLTVTVNKDLINSGASDRLGDCVRVYCTGVTGATAWRIQSIIGTWAKEA